jgi:hypothetical protein
VDRSDVIFCPFHSYVTFAVNLVTESVISIMVISILAIGSNVTLLDQKVSLM